MLGAGTSFWKRFLNSSDQNVLLVEEVQGQKRVEPQVTIQLPNFTEFSSSWLFSSTSLKKVLRLLLSVEYFRRAFSLGFLLRPLGVLT